MLVSLADPETSVRRPPPVASVLESARLVALNTYRILDRTQFAPLDLLVGQIAASLGAGYAAVSFIDDSTIWLTASFGFDIGRTPRADSLCDTVVRSARPMIVADALGDPRVRGHVLLQEPFAIRSYAGAPLVDGDGYVLGTIAVFSRDVGVFGLDATDKLPQLAQMVAGFLSGLRLAEAAPAVLRKQGWLGVKTLGARDGASKRPGLVVLSVARGSPAEQAGLRPTDVLHTIDGVVLARPSDIVKALAATTPGRAVTLRFQRGGIWHEAATPVRVQRSVSIRPRQRG